MEVIKVIGEILVAISAFGLAFWVYLIRYVNVET
jgi:hypothetical protein